MPLIVELDSLLHGLGNAFSRAQRQLQRRQDRLFASLGWGSGGSAIRCMRVVRSDGEVLEVPLLDLVDRRAHRVAELLVEFYCEIVNVTMAEGVRVGLVARGPVDRGAHGSAHPVLAISITEQAKSGLADAEATGKFEVELRLDGRVIRRRTLVIDGRSRGAGTEPTEPLRSVLQMTSSSGPRVYLLASEDVVCLHASGWMSERVGLAPRVRE